MPEDSLAYLLLALDLVLVAAILTAPLLLVLWLLGRRGGGRQAREGDGLVLRRCDACHVGWRAVPGDDKSGLGLRLRRWQRRRTRRKDKPAPAWARRQGWSRCPSCLSRQVRTSSRHVDPQEAVR